MPPSKPSNVTLMDVAKHLGVSRATVSLVVRNSPLVAEATRQRVLAAFEALGYVYNRHAARMRSQSTKTVGVVVNDITNPYFSTLIRGVEACLGRSGFVTFLGNSDESLERQSWFLETVREHSIDGLVICPAETTRVLDVRRILSWGIPSVFASRYVAGIEVDYVGIDNRQGMALATAHLIGLGHRRIALIGGQTRSSTGRDRESGYFAALAKAKIRRDARLVAPSRLTRGEGKRIILDLLRMPDPPTAAVCGNDIVAIGVMLGLQAAGRVPGRDFGLVGFDDVPEASLTEPALTTVQVPQDRIGEEAAEMLLQRMVEREAPPRRIVHQASLVVRQTCGARE